MPTRGSASASEIHITAPARLHLGFLDPDGALGRRFGSIGLAISEPSTQLVATSADKTTVSGQECARTEQLIAHFKSAFDVAGHFNMTVRQAIPSHAGLGSGTQLALAIGASMLRLHGRRATAPEIGAALNRGARSAIGMTAFSDGGFVIDGGKADESHPPPVVARVEFPDRWRIVLAIDTETHGIHGKRETEAFAELASFPEAQAAHLCHITLMQMLPALLDEDIAEFGRAVTEMQASIGTYFAPVQGGSTFSSPRVEKIVRKMGMLGGHGIGQSSWGPTGFAFFDSQDAAERLYATLVEEAKASGVDLMVVTGRNQGATITAK